MRLLGKVPDAIVAKKIGRTESAVKVMRGKRKIRTVKDRWRRRV